jgi:hypothetical protein
LKCISPVAIVINLERLNSSAIASYHEIEAIGSKISARRLNTSNIKNIAVTYFTIQTLRSPGNIS